MSSEETWTEHKGVLYRFLDCQTIETDVIHAAIRECLRRAEAPPPQPVGARWRQISDEPPPQGEQVMLFDARDPETPPHAATLDEYGSQKTYVSPPSQPTHWLPVRDLVEVVASPPAAAPSAETPQRAAANTPPAIAGAEKLHALSYVQSDDSISVSSPNSYVFHCVCGKAIGPHETRGVAQRAFANHLHEDEAHVASPPRPLDTPAQFVADVQAGKYRDREERADLGALLAEYERVGRYRSPTLSALLTAIVEEVLR